MTNEILDGVMVSKKQISISMSEEQVSNSYSRYVVYWFLNLKRPQ